ncbi:MAG TPA: hypothetical protein VEW46_20930 [Pyrinomonadaceae bacterium]|nr:hypothetical protein [Pyrinomonadaceae bacterium]
MRSRMLFVTPCIGLLAFGVFFSGIESPTPDNAPSIVNKTRSFEVLGVQRGPQEVKLTLKNNYPKTVTAFQISIGDNFTITEELIFAELSDIGIRPQEMVVKTYPLPLSLLQNPSVNVIIKAIVLDDGTGDGDVLAFEDIKAARVGEEIQIRRTLKKLHEFINSGESNVTRLRNEVSASLNASDSHTLKEVLEIEPAGVINRHSNSRLSDNLKRGLENGRQNALRKISEIENLGHPAEEFVKLKNTYKRILTRL